MLRGLQSKERGGDGGGVDEQDEDRAWEGECGEGNAEEPHPPVQTTYPPGGPSPRTAHGDLRRHPGT